ncbi:hypothetical protein [Agromyces larvae]|uniref:DNA-binding protein n=1 Tax=Agromyces larvae TaxID=2929802 RepID=A0ABY4BY97_9MICO|nr:hypothetical protein [Agromyces larvae]UOE43172.1 hypothetical protein MTO99_13370 [Agromyces larvae]
MSIAATQRDIERVRGPLREALAEAHVVNDAEVLEQVVAQVVRARLSMAALAPAMQRLPAVPAGLARIAQATENAWKRIEDEFGLLTSTEVAARLGSRNANRDLAKTYRKRGQLLAVRRLNSFRYPGFQFTRDGQVRSIIPELVALAEEIGWPSEEVVLWLCAPSGAFDGDRPVDHLDEADLIRRARETATVEW